jgi:hypothetical protein
MMHMTRPTTLFGGYDRGSFASVETDDVGCLYLPRLLATPIIAIDVPASYMPVINTVSPPAANPSATPRYHRTG